MSARIFELPPALCLNGQPSIAALISRDQKSTSGAQLLLGKNYALSGDPPDVFSLLQSYRAFAWHGQLMADYSADTLCIDTRIGIITQLDGPDQILEEVTDYDGLAGAYLVFIDDEILFLLQPTMLTPGKYNCPVVRGQFGTPIQSHDAGADVFILRAKDLIPIQLPVKVGNTGQFKITLGVQSASDQVAFETEFVGSSFTPAAITGLTFNGFTANAPYDATHNFTLAWQLPDVSGIDLSKSYTLIEFLIAGVVQYTKQVAWPAQSLIYTYPVAHPAALTVRASFIYFNGWEAVQGPTTTIAAYKFSNS
ncbi:MAG TPA: hypothetical protein VN516_09985 [Candidatus Baltobacteraceae bacterium]|nr:hypothetical protein [Candidatus Baltobacteraceae bacterium]